MTDTIYMPAAGRMWTVHNESSRPTGEVADMLAWCLNETGGLTGDGAVRVLDAGARSRGHFSGQAGDRQHGHYLPLWTGRARYMMRLTLPADDWFGYGFPRVCWHAEAARQHSDAYGQAQKLWVAGKRKWGRWPIWIPMDWKEVMVHLTLHETGHLLEYDRQRRVMSEVFCEEFAAAGLERWRALRG